MQDVLVHEQHPARRGTNEDARGGAGVEEERLRVEIRSPRRGSVEVHQRGDEQRTRLGAVDVHAVAFGERRRRVEVGGIHVEVPLEIVPVDGGVGHSHRHAGFASVSRRGHGAGNAVRFQRVRGHRADVILGVERAHAR